MQSAGRAFLFAHPCIHDPLKASQYPYLHFDEQNMLQSENLLASQPTKNQLIQQLQNHIYCKHE